MKAYEFITEKWSQKYKSSINCSHPKGFSQRAHCAGKKKHNESTEMEMVCEDCGMCQTHGNLNEIKKGAKDANGYTRCWPGKHAEGTKKGKNGGQVRNCVPNESEELDEIDRRGFLKGVGAAAGVAALGAPKDTKADWFTGQHTDNLTGGKIGFMNNFSIENPNIQLSMRNWSNLGGYVLVMLGFPKVPLTRNIVSFGDMEGSKTNFSAMVGDKVFRGLDGILIPSTDSTMFLLGVQNKFNKQLFKAIIDSYVDNKGSNDIAVEVGNKVYHFKGQVAQQGQYSPAPMHEELAEEFDLIESIIDRIAEQNGVDAEAVWEDLESLTEDELYAFAVTSQLNEDWQKANKKDRTAGMSQKAVNAYRREHPGSKLKTAVTTKPSKLKKGSKASKRRKSYCSRSRGQMKMHNISCAKTPDKAICKARRRWNC